MRTSRIPGSASRQMVASQRAAMLRRPSSLRVLFPDHATSRRMVTARGRPAPRRRKASVRSPSQSSDGDDAMRTSRIPGSASRQMVASQRAAMLRRPSSLRVLFPDHATCGRMVTARGRPAPRRRKASVRSPSQSSDGDDAMRTSRIPGSASRQMVASQRAAMLRRPSSLRVLFPDHATSRRMVTARERPAPRRQKASVRPPSQSSNGDDAMRTSRIPG
jgi:hypothetical protein